MKRTLAHLLVASLAAITVLPMATVNVTAGEECVMVMMWSGPSSACCCGGTHARGHCDTCAGRYEYWNCGGVWHIVVICGGL